MRASIRRIDLTQQPARVDVWPSMDWLSGEIDEVPPAIAPRGRSGLWTAMANAVARARQASAPTDSSDPVASDSHRDLFDEVSLVDDGAEVIDLATEAPHLAYLARVAAGGDGTFGEDGTYEADVIVFDGPRWRAER